MSSLSKFHVFFVFCPSNFWGLLLFFVLLPFPFQMFACFFETSFPNIPFLKPKLLSFWLFLFSSVVFVLYVSALLFLCWFGFWSFFVLFLSCFLFCFQSMKNNVFPAILVFFELCWLKGSFICYALCFCSCYFVSCVFCLQSKQWSCIVLCICCPFFPPLL